ncbi:SPASM domain-containing protein [Anaerovoracaceae bacterium 41-7]
MKPLYINQYEDAFFFESKIIVVNYVKPGINFFDTDSVSNVINTFSKNTDSMVNNFLKKYKLNENQSSRKATLTLIPSYNCNMACEYCFEGRMPISEVNKKKGFTQFLKKLIESYHYTSCDFILLGGEPVLSGNLEIFKEYISEARNLLQVDDIICVTNGLEVKKYYGLLKKIGITKYQITLDGMEKVHNLRRPAKNKSVNSFLTVCKTIDFLIDQNEDLEIRINVDQNNIAEINKIIQLAFDTKWYRAVNKGLRIYAYPVSENGVCSNICYSSEADLLKLILDELNALPIYKRIVSIRVHGIDFIDALCNNKFFSPILKFCGANSNQFVFTPNGNVYPCWWGHQDKCNVIGNYEDDVHIKQEVLSQWNLRDIMNIKECKNCKYKLLCGGGCTYKAQENKGTINCGNCADFYSIFKYYLRYKYDL